MPASFDEFFKAATGNTPYNYQSRLAGGDAGRPCESQLISIPTGLGKTAMVFESLPTPKSNQLNS